MSKSWLVNVNLALNQNRNIASVIKCIDDDQLVVAVVNPIYENGCFHN